MDLNKPLLLALLFALPFAISPAAAPAADSIQLVSILDVHPTQERAGLATVAKVSKGRFGQLPDGDEARLVDTLKKEKPLKGVLGPQGVFYLTDGHHRALSVWLAVVRICAKTQTPDLCQRRAQIPVLIEEDHQLESLEKFTKTMLSKNAVYLRPETRKKLSTRGSPTAPVFGPIFGKEGVLPLRLQDLADDPVRSSFSQLFFELKVDGSDFKNYLEFFLAEKIGATATIPAGKEFDEATLSSLKAALFENEQTIMTLRCLARPEKWEAAQRSINRVLQNRSKNAAPSKAFTPEQCSRELTHPTLPELSTAPHNAP